MPLKGWIVAESKRLYEVGAEPLGLAELLTYLLRNTEAVQALLERFKDIRELGSATYDDLVRVRGISDARAEQILAAFEIGKRLLATPADEKAFIRSPDDVFNLLSPRFTGHTQETFLAMLLNSKNRLLRTQTVGIGIANASLVHPREVFRPAIRASATALIIAHNHPSGDPEPSREDISITEQIVKSGEVVNIQVVDHVIIGDGRYVSMKERSLI
jgi:DNA repair protein RadC